MYVIIVKLNLTNESKIVEDKNYAVNKYTYHHHYPLNKYNVKSIKQNITVTPLFND